MILKVGDFVQNKYVSHLISKIIKKNNESLVLYNNMVIEEKNVTFLLSSDEEYYFYDDFGYTIKSKCNHIYMDSDKRIIYVTKKELFYSNPCPCCAEKDPIVSQKEWLYQKKEFDSDIMHPMENLEENHTYEEI